MHIHKAYVILLIAFLINTFPNKQTERCLISAFKRNSTREKQKGGKPAKIQTTKKLNKTNRKNRKTQNRKINNQTEPLITEETSINQYLPYIRIKIKTLQYSIGYFDIFFF